MRTKRKVVSVGLFPAGVDTLQDMADSWGVSRAEIIRAALRVATQNRGEWISQVSAYTGADMASHMDRRVQ